MHNNDIDYVIEQFDLYLDATHEPMCICGIEFAPSEVLNTMAFTTYTKYLDEFISEMFDQSVDDDGEPMYAHRRNVEL